MSIDKINFKAKIEDENYLEINELIKNISEDRNRKSNKIDHSSYNIETSLFSLEELTLIKNNLKLLRCLNGHKGAMLRNLISKSTTEEANYLNFLFTLSKNKITESILREMAINQPSLLKDSNKTIDVYEKLRFLEGNPDIDIENYDTELLRKTAEVLGLDDDKPKWINMIDMVFLGDDTGHKLIRELLDKIGFIPTELLNKKKIKNVGGKKFICLINYPAAS